MIFKEVIESANPKVSFEKRVRYLECLTEEDEGENVLKTWNEKKRTQKKRATPFPVLFCCELTGLIFTCVTLFIAHEFVVNRIHQCLPGCFNDVKRNAYGSPLLMLIL